MIKMTQLRKKKQKIFICTAITLNKNLKKKCTKVLSQFVKKKHTKKPKKQNTGVF